MMPPSDTVRRVLAQGRATLGAIALFAVLSAGCRASEHAREVAPNRTYLVIAHDYAFTGIPERAPAGWLTFRMVNAGQELHMFGIARVQDGHTMSEAIDSLTHDREVPTDPGAQRGDSGA